MRLVSRLAMLMHLNVESCEIAWYSSKHVSKVAHEVV